jgi:N4-gp56 family major capsid protein
MAYQTTASPGLSAEVREHYDKVLLFTAKEELVHDRYAMVKGKIPRGEGKVINWRRFELLEPATTALTEGVTPDAVDLEVTAVAQTVEEYGRWIGFSNRVKTQSIDDLVDEMAELLGYNAGHTIDILARDEFSSGTNVRYVGQTSRGAITTSNIITDAELKKIRRTLRRNKARPFNSGTGKPYFVGIVHPDVYMDLQGTDGWKNTGYYSDPQHIYDGEVKMLYDIMFVESTHAKVFTGAGATGNDVYSTIVFGRDALGHVNIEDLTLSMIFHQVGSSGSADPLNQRGSSGWRTTYAAKIVNDDFVVRTESAATA